MIYEINEDIMYMYDCSKEDQMLTFIVIHIHYIFINVIYHLIICCIIKEDIMYIYEREPSVDVCDMAEQYWPMKVSKYGIRITQYKLYICY